MRDIFIKGKNYSEELIKKLQTIVMVTQNFGKLNKIFANI